MKMKIDEIGNVLDDLIPNPRCELNYNKDYELLIATVLSAQATDKSVNQVTAVLFAKYDSLKKLKNADIKDLKRIIRSIGTYERKSAYIKEIARILDEEYDGVVPKNRFKLQQMPGVGRKTANVVLNNIYNVPAFAVDTHVKRIATRLGLCKKQDEVDVVERKLMRKFKREEWGRRHHQFVLFGRYYCKAKNPACEKCKLKKYCKEQESKKIKITEKNQ